jgi:hypothetical protein
LGDFASIHECIEPIPVLCEIHCVHAGPHNLTIEVATAKFCREWLADIDRCLAAKLNHYPIGSGLGDDIRNFFCRYRLEKQPVRRIVIRRDGLGIIVDYVSVDTQLSQRRHCVNRTVVELHPLPDSDRSAADDYHALSLWVYPDLAHSAG